MEQVKNNILLGESTNQQAVTKPSSSANTNELINLIKTTGINHELWNDLCLAAATNYGTSSGTFRNRLQEHLNTIGIKVEGLFCHKQSSTCGYSNAWAGTQIQMSTVKVDGNYFSAFLTYTI
ncbi:MAG: hypothetical protein ACRBFS_03460 [Aureispira sp.]